MSRSPIIWLLACGALVLLHPCAAQPAPAELYFPPASGPWETVAPSTAGWDGGRLDSLLDWAGEKRSSEVLIVLHGRILAERHYDMHEPRPAYSSMRSGQTSEGCPIEDVASVQKSVLVILAGVARGQGLLDFDAPVSRYLGAGWSKASAEQEKRITLRHLMSMTTGLSTGYEYQVDAGARWQYNTNVYSRLIQVLEKAFGKTAEQYTSEKLSEPLGMTDSAWTERLWLRPGVDANRLGFTSSARDLARFGILTLARGRWDGDDLLGDPKFYDDALSPSQQHNRSYGLLWWLNGQESSIAANGTQRSGSLMPTAPDDMVAGLGALGRKLYVVPSLGLVVVRLGDAPGEGFDGELWRRLLEAAPLAERR